MKFRYYRTVLLTLLLVVCTGFGQSLSAESALTLESASTALSPSVSVAAADTTWPIPFSELIPFSTRAWQAVAVKLQNTLVTCGAKYPHVTENLIWQTSTNGDWTGGFFAGELWLAAEEAARRNDPLATYWRQQAIVKTNGLASRRFDTGTHDLGFLFMPTWVEAYKQTGEVKWRDGAILAAKSLTARYAPGGFIQSWGKIGQPPYGGTVIIDNMMNLELLYWAAQESGNSTWADMATSHARLTQASHVRRDGGTFHLVDFDRNTGTMLRGRTFQGLADNSTWSRGQAWGIAGFTLAYRYTKGQEFLNTAGRLADYFIAHLPADGVAPWDFSAKSGAAKDTSANAIAAFGLIELARELLARGDARSADSRLAQARRLLEALHPYSLFAHPELRQRGGLLTGGTYNYKEGKAIEQSVAWGDYYYLRALINLAHMQEK